jgi:hypothetical protein
MKALHDIKINFPQEKIKFKSKEMGNQIFWEFKTNYGRYVVYYIKIKKYTWEFNRIEKL